MRLVVCQNDLLGTLLQSCLDLLKVSHQMLLTDY